MRTKINDRRLPDYSRGEEIFNMVSHIVGGGFAVIALALCVIKSAFDGDPWKIVSSVVYGLGLLVMYCMSSVYHGLHPSRGKKVLQVLDHCAIYFTIAGTYTVVALCALRGVNPTLAFWTLGVEWALTALAVTLNAIDLKQFAPFSICCYIVMGWGILPFYRTAVAAMGQTGFLLLLLGGISFTIGAILYGIGSKKRYFHCVFHVFVLLGSILHFVSIFLYVL